MITGDGRSRPVQHRSSALCWAARLITIVPAAVLAIWNIGALATADSHRVDPGLYLFDAVLFAIGLLVGMIAFWRHRIGGLCLLLVPSAYVIHGLIRQQDLGDTPWWAALLLELPFVAALAAGGALHLLAWRREGRQSLNPAVST